MRVVERCESCPQTLSLAAAAVDMRRLGLTSFTSTGTFESLHGWYVKCVATSGSKAADDTTRLHYAWLRAAATRVMAHLNFKSPANEWRELSTPPACVHGSVVVLFAHCRVDVVQAAGTYGG